MTRYNWPRNVRELANVLDRASTLSVGTRIRKNDIVMTLPGADFTNGHVSGSEFTHLKEGGSFPEAVKRLKQEIITASLTKRQET
ncbi:MAG: hypothetical protein M1511_10205 [Deltaproteobacteria bacterium]|nr:hypothetical protein [Deltaproteobacteria bacterium]